MKDSIKDSIQIVESSAIPEGTAVFWREPRLVGIALNPDGTVTCQYLRGEVLGKITNIKVPDGY